MPDPGDTYWSGLEAGMNELEGKARQALIATAWRDNEIARLKRRLRLAHAAIAIETACVTISTAITVWMVAR